MEIMKASGSGATQYPMYRTELLSNYDIAKDIMRISLSNTDQIMFDHSRSTKTCLRCPSDEGELLIKPEFPGPQTVNYYLTTPTQTVEEALISQFENVKFAYESRQNLCENGEQ
jgi:hypothetical protein